VIGIDTNVLVRHIVQDDDEQARAATRLIETRCTAGDPGLISLVVLCELVWVLDCGYGYDRDTIVRLLRRLLAVDDLRIEGSELAWQAVGLYEKGKADFADYVIGLSHSAQGAEITYTFDRQASRCKLFKLVGR
jgi:predicted nucleic-acid-binding protein